MSQLQTIKREAAKGKAKILLDGVKANFGEVPNIFKGMTISERYVEAYEGIG